jgi:hypothetical protein
MQGLGYLKRPSEDWFAVLKWCLDQIDQDLRNRRNRFIHDHWHLGIEKGLQKTQYKTGFRKPKAFELEYYTQIVESVDREKVWGLNDDLFSMTVRLNYLSLGLMFSDDKWRTSLAELSLLPPLKSLGVNHGEDR